MVQALLVLAARHAKPLLIAGLAAGVLLPGLAGAIAAQLPLAAAGLLALAALRIGPRSALGLGGGLRFSLGAVAVLQMALPLVVAGVLLGFGWTGPLATALVLMAAGAPISSTPNLTIMSDGDPAPALRMVILGTAALPLTLVPALWLWPAFGDFTAVMAAAGRTIGVLAVSVGFGFGLRAWLFPDPTPRQLAAIDGFSALAMALAVTGLMTALRPALMETPMLALWVMVAAFASNFGLQIATAFALRGRSDATGLAIGAGNRSLLLFLAVLPASFTAPLLLFVACYQVPMYLTPILLGRFYRYRISLPRRPAAPGGGGGGG